MGRVPYNQPIRIYDFPSTRGFSVLRFGMSIARERESLQMSIEMLSRAVKIPLKRLKNVEAGRGDLTLEELMRLAKALGCSLRVELLR